MKVYCAKHREVEHLTDGAAERYVYALQAALADAETEPNEDRIFVDENGWSHVLDMCPINHPYDDGEMYREHIDAMVDARRYEPATPAEMPVAGTSAGEAS